MSTIKVRERKEEKKITYGLIPIEKQPYIFFEVKLRTLSLHQSRPLAMLLTTSNPSCLSTFQITQGLETYEFLSLPLKIKKIKESARHSACDHNPYDPDTRGCGSEPYHPAAWWLESLAVVCSIKRYCKGGR